MATLKIEINLDNAAFHPYPLPEVGRLLGSVEVAMLATLPDEPLDRKLLDVNGNTVGRVWIEEPDAAAR